MYSILTTTNKTQYRKSIMPIPIGNKIARSFGRDIPKDGLMHLGYKQAIDTRAGNEFKTKSFLDSTLDICSNRR
eukprot:m.578 g.578  ORF g.578 m.578 type:complete len:74 (-) comp265_c0_seq1:92-313(-)